MSELSKLFPNGFVRLPNWLSAEQKNFMLRAMSDYESLLSENQRLAEIATKHATVNDERYELLEKQKSGIEKMLDQLFKHEKVDAWLVCKMNDMLDDVNHQLGNSKASAVIVSNDD